ncbi:uncharacterized protein cubi_00980 [Cryptosporidium ubiquitum]|uniref:Uncharacterized protein n=1 Tax=Cryptosporidium ubiquitum TaxID=857276 RepID=A0A1J4MBI3_9CRYT|nr:uncharacterized protein cubi_00980 [Cryptosporidium ubiquitum]OII70835.1 hypothetical protein cubi_00980 [Cryptosporidium ubiquitum]
MFKYLILLNTLVIIYTFYFNSNKLEENFILDISLIKTANTETNTGAPLVSNAQVREFGVFTGKGTNTISAYVTSFGIGFDLSVNKKCSTKKIKILIQELENLMLKLFKNYGRNKELEKSQVNEAVQSPQLLNELNNLTEEIQNQNRVLENLLTELYACILSKTAIKYSNKSMRKNKKSCNLVYLVYHSSLKSMSKILISILKEVLEELSKSYNKCLKSINISPEMCYQLGVSISSVESSILSQNQVLTESKSEKKKCKRYLRNKLMTRILGRNQGRVSGKVISETEDSITTYL